MPAIRHSYTSRKVAARIAKQRSGRLQMYDPVTTAAIVAEDAMQMQIANQYRRLPNNRRTGGYMGMELKFFDSSLAATAVAQPSDASGGEVDPTTLLCLSCPSTGDGEQNRDGRQITMKKISVTGLIQIPVQVNVTALDTTPYVMIALVLDTQTNKAQLNSEDVFTNPSAGGGTAASPFRNLQYTKRFRILKKIKVFIDQLMPSYDGTNIEITGSHTPWELHADLKDLEVNFEGTTSVVGAVIDNSIHLIAYASTVTYVPQILYNARLRFTG